MQNIRNIIRQLAQPDGETVALVCMVDAVDKSARTVDCTPINEGAPLLGVNLQANQGTDFGLCLFPEIGSFVVVGFIADGSAGVVLLTEKIESAEMVIGETSAVMDADGITFNGGDLGGLVVIQKLTDKLNELTDTVNTLIKNYNSHTHQTTATIGPGETPGIISTVASPAKEATKFDRSDYENKKITQ